MFGFLERDVIYISLSRRIQNGPNSVVDSVPAEAAHKTRLRQGRHDDDDDFDLLIRPYSPTLFLYTSATLDHQDKTSLALMILSIAMALYLSEIRRILLLLSSSIRYTRLNVLPHAESLYHTSASLYSSQ